MSAYNRVRDIVAIILNSVAQEADVPTEYLSIEVESVVTRGVLEAYGRGKDDSVGERDTTPPPGTPPHGTQQPPGDTTAPPPRQSRAPTQVFGSSPQKKPRVPTPRPRRYIDPRREPDED